MDRGFIVGEGEKHPRKIKKGQTEGRIMDLNLVSETEGEKNNREK